jgi:hypothetical protein
MVRVVDRVEDRAVQPLVEAAEARAVGEAAGNGNGLSAYNGQ